MKEPVYRIVSYRIVHIDIFKRAYTAFKVIHNRRQSRKLCFDKDRKPRYPSN